MAAKSPPTPPYSPENFNLETKLIVLNFIGYNPHDSPSQSIQSTDLFRGRFCHPLPVTPDLHKQCNHRSSLQKQKTAGQLYAKQSSSSINEEQVPRRKSWSLETVSPPKLSLKFKKNVTLDYKFQGQSSSADKESLDDYRADDEMSQSPSPCVQSNDLNTEQILSPANDAWLNPDTLFASHKATATTTPKSLGFEPTLEDWKNLEAAVPVTEGEDGLTEITPEIQEFVDSLLSDVVRLVVEGEMRRQQKSIDEVDAHIGFHTGEYQRGINGNDDISSSSADSCSSMSIENFGPSPEDVDSVTSHEIDGCSCHSIKTPPSDFIPGDRSKLRLHIVNHSSPAVEESVLNCMRAELSEELSSLESELENVLQKQRNGEVVSPLLTPPLTPQSNAARVLARIGDEVRAKYEFQLEDALHRLFIGGQQTFSYETFRESANQIVDQNLPGWRQVVLLLVYGQSVTWRAVESGQRGIGNLISYTTRLLSDYAAEFIINQGGWEAVMSLESSVETSPDQQIGHYPLNSKQFTDQSHSLNQSNHPLHSKQLYSQSHSLYESCAMSVKAGELFSNHQNVTANNSSYHDSEVMSIFVDPTQVFESMSQGGLSSSGSDESPVPDVPSVSAIISESDFSAGRFQGWDDHVFTRSRSEEYLSNMLMISFNIGTLIALIYFSQNGRSIN
ncbi:uncharacterized protein LOC133186465 [Saccostrea echinata]|uniref:uncharacterized protein LOC133186465 n=1 Tax=Saccostrea echinata TaxID=191078 RepID=UPI002A83B371|nr:uncharacterized protein LOC133186465 [Saccostrea echinata]